TTSELIIEAMDAAKKSGAVTSFDLNYRGKLWKPLGGEKKAVATLRKIVEHVDVLIGNEEDMQKGLGIPGPEVTKQDESKLDTKVFFEMIGKTVKQFSKLKAVATTLRETHSSNRHDWAAVLWLAG